MAAAQKSSLGLGGLTWTELGQCVWRQIGKDEGWGHAAQLSYYFLFALFPFLLFLTEQGMEKKPE